MSGHALAGQIDALLPQTQCTKCGYAGCRPYAEAVAAGAAEINRCPPGGSGGIARLAALLGRNAVALDPDCGAEQPRAVALIDETRCIGCTLCIQACPVDAIVGAAKLMHTVIAELCTGCDLCLPPCPVDCITLVRVGDAAASWTPAMADAARARFEFRNLRLAREQDAASARLARKAQEKPARRLPDTKQAAILAALERARARKARGAAGNADHPPTRVRAPATAADTRRGAAKKR